MGNKEKINKKRFWYPPEYEKMFSYLNKNGQFSANFQTQTGCRINEGRGFMKNPIFDNVRFNITLTETKVRAKLGERRPEPRTIPVSKQFFRELKEAVNNKSYRILSTNALNIALRRACIKAKISNPEEFSSHHLRKNFATWMLSLGVDAYRLAQHLGHTPAELAKDYACNDVFNHDDKRIMRSIFKELPDRIDQK